MIHRSTVAIAVAVLTAGLSAQTFHHSPSGTDILEANANNTIPWWATSATYQQIHDGADLTISFGGPVALITSINFRKDTGSASSSITGRSLDSQVTLGTTTVTPTSPTSNFATNLGPTPQLVLPYTTINFPTVPQIATPNPIGWSIPFTTPYVYVAAAGNLCWEWRFLNNSTTASAACDAVSGINTTASALLGTGCVATGQTQAATIGLRSLSLTSGAWRNRLDRGAATTPTVMLVGLLATPITLPGFCSGLEFLPLADVTGLTDATGTWDFTLTFGSILGMPPIDILAQFAFVDGGLPNGVGLSPASSFTTPPQNYSSVARIYAAPFQGGAGNETAQTGVPGTRFGLVTVFGQ